jgi:type II secretion system protein H
MFTINNIRSDRSGFTLIEMLIIISIMAFLSTIAVLNFQTWQKKNNIEAETRDLFSQLTEARNNAFMQKTEYGVIIKSKGYQIKSYTSEADTTGAVVKSGTYVYNLTQNGGTDIAAAGIQARFDSSGFLSSTTGTIGPSGTIINVEVTDTSTSLNCLVIQSTRVNMGKWNATTPAACEYR